MIMPASAWFALAMAPMLGAAVAAQWWGDAYLRAMIGRGSP